MSKKDKKITEKERYRLKKFIEKLEGIRGRGTELVSVYIPADYNIDKIRNHIAEEQGTAENIKSKQTRDNVKKALEKIKQHLKRFSKTPENGLVVFAGNVSERRGHPEHEVFSLQPPIPLNQRIYKCDKEFMLEPLRELAEDKDFYGMIVIDRREGNIALLKGKTIIPLVTKNSRVPGKFKTGGQSAQRFARIREGAAKKFYKKIGNMAKEQFYDRKHLKGILVGGPGPTKEEFVNGDYLPTKLKDKILTIKDLSYTGEFGLQELLEKSEDVLAEQSVIEEKQILNKFFTYLKEEPGMVTYGRDETMKLVKLGAVDTVLISEDKDDDVVDEFMGEASKVSSNVKLISTETREGVQLQQMGGIVAILRYNAGDMT